MKTGSQTTSAQSTGKNKKLLHEYASFDKKVGYFLLSSTYKGKHFAKGSMAPKIQAIIWYLEAGGKQALITNPENIGRALAGETGTWIVP